MASKSSIASLAAILIAAAIQSSVAQTTHDVGNNSGWTIPNGGAAFYSTWAAGQVFSVNDILGKNSTYSSLYLVINRGDKLLNNFILSLQCLTLRPTNMMFLR